jgi:hypothetical protein
MPWRERFLWAFLGGASVAGAILFLGSLVAIAVVLAVWPGYRARVDHAVATIAPLAGLVSTILLLTRQKRWSRQLQTVILGAAAGALAILAAATGLELAFGPRPIAWTPLFLKVSAPLTLTIPEWAVLSLPAAMLLGAAAGRAVGAAKWRHEANSPAER